jgi:hypothetical protein
VSWRGTNARVAYTKVTAPILRGIYSRPYNVGIPLWRSVTLAIVFNCFILSLTDQLPDFTAPNIEGP